jgi:DnaA family protein
MSRQLPLELSLRPPATLGSFVPGDNGQALNVLGALADGRGETLVFLHGPSGSGKTHLLAGTCGRAMARGARCAYVPLAEAASLSPELLTDLDGLDVVCIDDIDAIAGERAWEEALFRLFNTLREAAGRLVVSAGCPPGALQISLADLRSRLGWGLTLGLRPLQDDALAEALRHAASARGLRLDAEVARYILERCPRHLPTLLRLLEDLDRASLAAQRALTIPFVKSRLQPGPGHDGAA